MNKPASLACFLVLVFSAGPLFADTLFDFSFAGTTATGFPATPFSGSGQFDAVPTAQAGEYQVMGVTGTTDGQTISTILGSGMFGGNDNFLFVNGSTVSLDNSGVSYRLANGVDVNLFLGYPDQDQQAIFGYPGTLVLTDQTTPITINELAPTPEPSSFLLLGTGLLGFAGAVRRRLAA